MNPSKSGIINALTIDLEDYYQVSAFESVVRREEWGNYESRIERNTYRVLEILAEAGRAHPSFVPPYAGLRRTSSAESTAKELVPCAENVPPPTSTLHPTTSTLQPLASPTATFFCLGWIGERHPNLIKEIQNQGHEIACHSYDHQLVYNMTPEEFRQDIRRSKKILEDIVGTEVIGYRAPSYSITHKSLWAFQILAEEGFRYDSSIFPIHHDRYGIPDAPRFLFVVDFNNGRSPQFVPLSDDTRSALCSMPYAQNASTLKRSAPLASSKQSALHLTPHASQCLIELPISTVRLCGQNIPISGGGYFRLFPYRVAKRALVRINHKESQPFVFYFHPWELDDKQPKIGLLGFRSRFRHYANLKQTEVKLRKLLAEFSFSSVKESLKLCAGVTQ